MSTWTTNLCCSRLLGLSLSMPEVRQGKTIQLQRLPSCWWTSSKHFGPLSSFNLCHFFQMKWFWLCKADPQWKKKNWKPGTTMARNSLKCCPNDCAVWKVLIFTTNGGFHWETVSMKSFWEAVPAPLAWGWWVSKVYYPLAIVTTRVE